MKARLVLLDRESMTRKRDQLLEQLDGCDFEGCPHHWEIQKELDTVEWLLENDEPGYPPADS